MKYWRALIMLLTAALLVACYHRQDQADVPVPPVPTSPNAAYQTAFPPPETTETATAEAGTPETETTVTPIPHEDVTATPETIMIEPPGTTPTPGEE